MWPLCGVYRRNMLKTAATNANARKFRPVETR